jgi:hypothetical protein
MVEYDLWRIIATENGKNYIYHPLTQTFLGVEGETVVCSQTKTEWEIKDFGRRRNGGFIQLIYNEKAEEDPMQLCMTDQPAILEGHRKVGLCRGNHVGHLWEIDIGECVID